MRKWLLILCALVLALVLTGCGEQEKADASPKEEEKADATSKDEKQAESDVEEESTTINIEDLSGQSLSFEEAPQSIATLSSGDLDMLLALGANVTGRPSSQGPVADELKGIEEIGNPHQPNFEKIAEVHPEVLVAGMSFQQHAANLEKQGTKVLYTKANSIDDIQQTITLFGQLLNKESEASDLVSTITKQVEEVQEAKGETVRALLVYGAPGTYLAALPNSLSGDLLEKAGGENIAADFPKEDNYPQYASLSVEKIIERNPQVVMLITHGEPKAVQKAFEEEMTKNAAWKNLDAVKEGNVIVLPSHLFGTNPGTKVVDALHVMKESLEQVQ